jgi:hypothetical protein
VHGGRTARRLAFQRLVRGQLLRVAGRLGPRAHSARQPGAARLGPLAALRRGQRFPEHPLPEAALARADRLVRHPVREQRLALRPGQRFPEHRLPEAARARADLLVQHRVREQRLALRRGQRALPWARQVRPLRRSAACLGQLGLPGGVPARAHEAVRRAPQWARPAALARRAPGLPRAVRGAPGLRQAAAHAVAGRPAAPGAAEGQPRAAQQAWAQPGAAARAAPGAGVPRQEAQQARDAAGGPAARDAAVRPAVRDAARRLAARDVAAVRPSAAVSVFRQDRVRLEPVQRRSERFARATAC